MSVSSTNNIRLGVCRVLFNKIDLGLTKGGVEVTVKTETHKVNVDQYGKTTVKELIMSRDVTVKAPLAETTLDNLVLTMPGTVLTETGEVGSEVKKLVASTGVGIDLLSIAKELRLHPTDRAANDVSDDFVIPLAATPGALNYAYKVDDERVFNVEFSGYPAADGTLFKVGE